MSVTWGVGSDLETDRRRRSLAQSQPLTVNWVAVLSWLAALMVGLACWRVVYVHRAGLLAWSLVIGFVLPWLIAGVAWAVSAWRGEAGGTGI